MKNPYTGGSYSVHLPHAHACTCMQVSGTATCRQTTQDLLPASQVPPVVPEDHQCRGTTIKHAHFCENFAIQMHAMYMTIGCLLALMHHAVHVI